MRLNLAQLAAHLRQPLLPVYLVTGDEPLQLGETLSALRAAAQAQGYGEREVLEQDAHFDWRLLAGAASNLSLFGDRRLLELRLESGKIGAEGSQALVAYCQRPPEDTLLLISGPRLERAQTSAKWVQSLDAVGALVPIWPLERRQLPDWLRQRLMSRGLGPGPGVCEWLAERVEGNLLAAAQEVEKLLLLHGPGDLDLERLRASIADSARYSIFDLAEAALAGDAARCLRILEALRAEGTPEPLALWALLREVRLVLTLAGEVRGGRPLTQVLAGHREIWEKRRPLYASALRRLPTSAWQGLLEPCARVDRAIKGLTLQDPWLLLQDLALAMCGLRLPAAAV